MRHYALIACVFLSVAHLGCSQEPAEQAAENKEQKAPGEAPEEIVERRAGERWEFLIALDYAKAYEYLSPGERAGLSLKSYRARLASRSIGWKAANVQSVQCDAEVCEVRVKVDSVYAGSVKAMMGQEMSSEVKENWVRSGGSWWFVPR